MKKLAIGMIIGIVLALALPVIAQNVEVELNKINIRVNNQKVNSENILYNGRTYVPLRVISETLGKEVIWIADTNTAEINDQIPAEFTLVKIFEGDTKKKTESFKLAGSETRITWNCEDDGYFSATLYDINNKYIESIASATKKGSEVTYFRQQGEYYLDISSTGKYSIKIEQRK